MSTSSTKGLLSQAINARVVDLVGINEVKFIKFDRPAHNKKTTLGVKGLGACSVAAVVSEHGAIVAHIGPNILNSKEADSFVKLASNRMDVVEQLCKENKALFDGRSDAYVIYATFQNTPTSPEQTAIFRNRLQGLGLPIVKDTSYERPQQASMSDERPEGTVWVVKRHDAPATVYLEDRNITPRPTATSASSSKPSSSSRPAVSSSASSSKPSSSSQASSAPTPPGTSWVVREGEGEYRLVDSANNVVQRSRDIPRGVRIYIFARNGTRRGVGIWDGSRWSYPS